MIKKIENHYEIEIQITENKLGINTEELFQMATRNNNKRKFLFVSTVLGKHLSVKPSTAILTGKLLGALYIDYLNNSKKNNDLKNIIELLNKSKKNELDYLDYKSDVSDNTTVIAFAETATSLGHIVFSTFTNGYAFYHTTREKVDFDGNVINFEEEHSHATSHLVYENPDFKILDSKTIVLVDDEISTGNTLLNIMKSLNSNYNTKKFSVLTIMDLRKEEDIQKFRDFEKKYDVEINVISILKGHILNVTNGDLTLEEIKSHDIFNKREVKFSKKLVKKIYINNFKVSNSTNNYLDSTGRFGISSEGNKILNTKIKEAAKIISSYVDKKTLILGTEEFMYIPMKIGSYMECDMKSEDSIYFKSTTRSPVFPCSSESYPIKSGSSFKSLYNLDVNNYIYNLEENRFDTIIVFVEEFSRTFNYDELNEVLTQNCKNVYFVIISNKNENRISYPAKMGSYSEDDVVFLLKDISSLVSEQSNIEREKAIQNGVHYSEMLPIEYKPTDKYLEIFYSSLKVFSKKIANSVAITAEKIIKAKGKSVVLVSLARAGTPAGILIKRYIKFVYNISFPHYSVSIVRGKGIDENAIKFILDNHKDREIQFVDGWTGKGAITKELNEAVVKYKSKYGDNSFLKSDLAVLADPGHTVKIYGTKEDFLIPNACLNSTISGLLSRTFLRDDIISSTDFHGVKFYKELMDEDLSNYYIEEVEKEFKKLDLSLISNFDIETEIVDWEGLNDVKNIERDFNIESIHFIKPGIGETTRVLLRRIPWKILISENPKNIEHVLQLAKEKNITVETYPLKAYYCCGIVKSLKGE